MAFDSQLIVRIESENALAKSGLGPKLNPASPRPAWAAPFFWNIAFIAPFSY